MNFLMLPAKFVAFSFLSIVTCSLFVRCLVEGICSENLKFHSKRNVFSFFCVMILIVINTTTG